MFSAYLIHIAILITISVILAVSLNVSLGYTGLINLGHIAFYGVGAYTSAILVLDGHSFVFSFISAGCLAAACGLLLSLITSRLKGDFFALATLGFSFVTYSLMQNWVSLTRGPLGIPGIPRPIIFGWSVADNNHYFLLALFIAASTCFFLWLLTRSRYGKLLQAVRDDSIGVTTLGKNVLRLKCESMMISAFFAGLAGSLFAHYINFIDPSSFFLTDIIIIITVVVVGGLASLKGSVVATVIILALPEALRFVSVPSSAIGAVRQIMYALILLVIILFRPRGLFGKVDLN